MKIGQRRSKQRELILEELKGVTCHPTADELYELVRKRLANISLGTVYRNLELMASNGVILKIESGGKNRFDGNAMPHPHMRCTECGKVDDITFDVNVPIPDQLEAKGYKITGCTIEYYGLCPECKNSC
ncbi:Fur family transcriptional regulator, ferric uptake regulator [Maridesulfovibrio ferrireducens]|uniref:Fur family transcriptional regulator, ferric uptake regulator n=1 Tax=Maridesulfovibrio ferrireducens TaxID=246191 RepID=A0A1G9BUL3_9BACT|nr:transcriptional repressor [Maridesulfovibrio ferrireducens]SDK43030.1 Fur family transcriptional regulator, ferric uptake regulator [Maridesulfovibrio ferrireducens]